MLYYMLNKPKGCVTASTDARHRTVMDCFPKELSEKLFPVGRLDRDTEGFLLLTNDGNLAFWIMRPESGVSKTYFLWAKGTITDEDIKRLESGVFICDKNNTFTAPAKAEMCRTATLGDIGDLLDGKDRKLTNKYADQPVFSMKLTITEGKKHQVKRMLGAVGCKVLYLKRVSIGAVELDSNLATGEYRALTDSEIEDLVSHIPCS